MGEMIAVAILIGAALGVVLAILLSDTKNASDH